MSSADLLGYTTDYWFWGERCSLQNDFNKDYFYCWKGDKPSCDDLKKTQDKLTAAKSTQSTSTPPTVTKPQ